MTTPVHEIVTCTVVDPRAGDAARTEALQRLQSFPGFIAWTAFAGESDPALRADLLTWRSLEEARAAGERVGAAPEFSGFRASIAGISSMAHYEATLAAADPLQAGRGVEIGRFRLKPGVGEEEARRAHAAMIEGHLARQPGWREQCMVKLEDGVFLDIAFADDRAQAKAICASWHGHALCEAFLALIEPDGLAFGTVL